MKRGQDIAIALYLYPRRGQTASMKSFFRMKRTIDAWWYHSLEEPIIVPGCALCLDQKNYALTNALSSWVYYFW